MRFHDRDQLVEIRLRSRRNSSRRGGGVPALRRHIQRRRISRSAPALPRRLLRFMSAQVIVDDQHIVDTPGGGASWQSSVARLRFDAVSARILCCVAIVFSLVTLSAGPLSTTRFPADSTGRIIVTVRLDGKAHAFVLDTATRHTTVSLAVATTLNRRIQESRPGVRPIDDVSLELLRMELPHQSLRVANEPILDEGVIGAELCKRFIVKVDFSARRITLWPPSENVKTRHAVVVPADFSNDVPVITAKVSAAGVAPSVATLAVGLAIAPGTVAFGYRYAADSGLLDTAPRRGSANRDPGHHEEGHRGHRAASTRAGAFPFTVCRRRRLGACPDGVLDRVRRAARPDCRRAVAGRGTLRRGLAVRQNRVVRPVEGTAHHRLAGSGTPSRLLTSNTS